MLCQKCGHKNASVHLTKIINGNKSEIYICEDCARENGELDFPLEGKFPLYQFFSGMMGMNVPGGDAAAPVPATVTGIQCSACGLTYPQFGQIGRFGCDRCYEAFGRNILPLFRRLHGNQKHMGKIPARAGTNLKLRKKIEQLKLELQKKIAEEAFEEAAGIRDRIRELEQKLVAGGETDA
ncbi:MAG: UvrB/UvrC motif-containing protein [Bacillota bacterium]